jgi:error-prone DNA polymerase
MLNNQPMGFYSSLTLIKDAQRHGLRFKSVDLRYSEWPCTVEEHDGALCVRLGFNYVKGFRHATAERLVNERQRGPFASIDELKRRVPELSARELNSLAELGALNALAPHRRDALWNTQLALRPVGELLEEASVEVPASPLAAMTPLERLSADFRNSGLTIGAHPMRFHREELQRRGIVSVGAAARRRDGAGVRVAGAVICRQQPATAKGFVFVSLEDETGIINVIVPPALFQTVRATLISEPYLVISGVLQNQQGAISVKASHVAALRLEAEPVASHDFH